jgi:hypothetical protein
VVISYGPSLLPHGQDAVGERRPYPRKALQLFPARSVETERYDTVGRSPDGHIERPR